MRLVFDTNVLISAYLSSGGPSDVAFAGALKKHTIILSDYILTEFRRTLQRKLNVPDLVIDSVVRDMKQDVVVLENIVASGIDFSDKNDIPVLALVRTAGAQILVTGDKKLLALKKFMGAVILSPRETMELI